ncbi:MAG: AAA family ATPase [Bacteroidetes bacterium]|nr:AAA family ATPase [Bacteroidota bacterium]
MKPLQKKLALGPDKLRVTIDASSLDIDSTENLQVSGALIGQPRAVSSLRFGLGIQEIGFNIFVAGPRGIGKMTAVRALLNEVGKEKTVPPDWCYVNDFADDDQPKALRLPAGRGKQLQQDMKQFTEYFSRELTKLFESDEYQAKQDELNNEMQARREAIMRPFGEEVSNEGFTLQSTPVGVVILPVKDKNPLQEADWAALSPEEQEALVQKRKVLEEKLKNILKEARTMERDAQKILDDFDMQAVQYLVGGRIDDMQESYEGDREISEWLADVRDHILDNLNTFKAQLKSKEGPQELDLSRYLANLFIDNSKERGAPLVVELNPTYTNLFGRIEKDVFQGTMYTDFTMIKPGALHRANGGYIVLHIEDVLKHFMSWDALKRALRSRLIYIEELSEMSGMQVTKSLKPRPIPLDVKVILIGHSHHYYTLHEYDDDFPELFKVKADFDLSMPREASHIKRYLLFVSTLCRKENLRHLDAAAVAKLLEYSIRLAEDRDKLSTHFAALADVIREANYWARVDQVPQISASHIKKALDEKVYRISLTKDRVKEYIEKKIILIDTRKSEVGQVNGLAVLHMGDFEFGRPNRITATVSPGTEGVTDIEKQVALGGPIHHKGVLILSGFLADRFARETPLALSCRIVFEQSYEGVEGDSASSTELYAILSALSGLKINQGIGVTGSVNQKGEVQAIGGVNEKIEGFFEICQVQGLTGHQGVLIPKSNVNHLMLREDVVSAVKKGEFHIWAVETISEGIEILTGRPAGKENKGKYPSDSVFGLVERRLQQFSKSLRNESKPAKKK